MLFNAIKIVTLFSFFLGQADFLVNMFVESVLHLHDEEMTASGNDLCFCLNCEDFDAIGCHCGTMPHGAPASQKEAKITLPASMPGSCSLRCGQSSRSKAADTNPIYSDKNYVKNSHLAYTPIPIEQKWCNRASAFSLKIHFKEIEHPPEIPA